MKRNQSLLLLALLLGLAANLNMAPSAQATPNTPSLFNMQEAYSNGLTNNGEAVKLAEAGKCGKGSCGAEMKKEASMKAPMSKCSKGKCSKKVAPKAKCSKAKCSKAKCTKKAAH